MQGTSGSDDGGGEWSCVGKKGKPTVGSSTQHGTISQNLSGKKAKKNSMKNARTLSLQAFYTEHGLPDESGPNGEQMAIGIGRGIVLMGGSSDYGFSPDEVLARESLLSYFEDLIKRTGPLRLNGPELRCHLQDRLEDSDSLLIGRGAESLSEAENFGAFLAMSADLILVDDYVCAIIDETKTKSMALTDILNSYVPTPLHSVSQPITTDKPTTAMSTSTSNPFGAIGSSPPAAMSSLPASNVWKSGPPSIIGSNTTGAIPGLSNNSSHTTCSPEVLVLGNVESLYQAAVKAVEPTKSQSQVSTGHPVFPVTLPDLTSPPPPLPSPSKTHPASAPLSAAVGSNRPVAAVTAMNNTSTDTAFKTAVGSGNVHSSASTAGVPTGTIESLNKRMQGLSLCNADLLRQLADKEKQLQRMIVTVNAQDRELDAARQEIARLKEPNVKDNPSIGTDDNLTTVPKSNVADTTASNTSDNHLIISLQKQLESEKLNSRNLKQQLELERVYASRITEKHNFLYNKQQQNSIHPGNVGASSSAATPMRVGGSKTDLDNDSLSSMALGTGSDFFGLRGLLANTTQQPASHHSDSFFERLIGNSDSDTIYGVGLSNSASTLSLKQSVISTPSPFTSSVPVANGRSNGSNLMNSTVPTSTSSALSTLSQHSLTRSEQPIGSLNRSNSTGAGTIGGKQNLYSVPPPGNLVGPNIGSTNRNPGGIGGSGLSLMGMDDSIALARNNSNSGGGGTESILSSILKSSVPGGKGSSQYSTDSSDDMLKKMSTLRTLQLSASSSGTLHPGSNPP